MVKMSIVLIAVIIATSKLSHAQDASNVNELPEIVSLTLDLTIPSASSEPDILTKLIRTLRDQSNFTKLDYSNSSNAITAKVTFSFSDIDNFMEWHNKSYQDMIRYINEDLRMDHIYKISYSRMALMR